MLTTSDVERRIEDISMNAFNEGVAVAMKEILPLLRAAGVGPVSALWICEDVRRKCEKKKEPS